MCIVKGTTALRSGIERTQEQKLDTKCWTGRKALTGAEEPAQRIILRPWLPMQRTTAAQHTVKQHIK